MSDDTHETPGTTPDFSIPIWDDLEPMQVAARLMDEIEELRDENRRLLAANAALTWRQIWVITTIWIGGKSLTATIKALGLSAFSAGVALCNLVWVLLLYFEEPSDHCHSISKSELSHRLDNAMSDDTHKTPGTTPDFSIPIGNDLEPMQVVARLMDEIEELMDENRRLLTANAALTSGNPPDVTRAFRYPGYPDFLMSFDSWGEPHTVIFLKERDAK